MIFSQFPNINPDMPYSISIKKQFSNELQWDYDFSVFFILQGQININIDDKGHLLSQNDIFFLEPFHTFSIITSSKDIQVLHLIINSDYIKKLVPDYLYIKYKTNYIRMSSESNPHLALVKNISQIVFHTIKVGHSEKLKCTASVTNILSFLIDNFGEMNKEIDHQTNYSKDRIKDIITYINEHYRDKIMVKHISDHLGIHPQYFSSFFKKYFKKTFIEFLNQYRIYRSINQLVHTNNSILSIAIDNGFSSHKTYSSFFKKIFHVTPSSYRADYQPANPSNQLGADIDQGLFSYLQEYWNEDLGNSSNERKIQRHISLNFDFKDNNHQMQHNKRPLFIDSGRASSCLRGEIQSIIRTAKKDLDFDFLRFKDIFSDDLFVYHEGANKMPEFNWHYIDIIIDFLVSQNIKPFLEIGYMPRDLASKKQFAGWNFQPNVSQPKSEEKWALLVTNFLKHCMGRYGIQEVLTWYFDFWICPDIPIKDGFWNDSMEEFFHFYYVTYQAVKSVDQRIQLGSPNFSTIWGMDWYEAFFNFCKEKDLFPNYISTRTYSMETVISNPKFISYTTDQEISFTLPDKDNISHQLNELQSIMDHHLFGDLQIIVSNWNISFLPIDLTRDTGFMAAYYAYIKTKTINQTYGLCFQSLSDMNEEFYPPNNLFHGGTGMVDFYGLKKSVYHAAALFSKLGNQVIDTSDFYIVCKSNRGYQIMVFNLSYYDALYRNADRSGLSYKQRYNIYEEGDVMNIHILIDIDPGSYSIKKSQLNRVSGSSFDTWLNMGAPEELNASLVEYIKSKSTPITVYDREDVSSSLIIDTLVESHEVILFEIERSI